MIWKPILVQFFYGHFGVHTLIYALCTHLICELLIFAPAHINESVKNAWITVIGKSVVNLPNNPETAMIILYDLL